MSGRSFVRKVIPVVLLLAAFAVWTHWRARSLGPYLFHSLVALQPGHPGPSFRLASLDGRTVSSGELRGKGKLVRSLP